MRSAEWNRSALVAVVVAFVLGLTMTAAPADAEAAQAFPAGDFESHVDGFTGVGDSVVELSESGTGRTGDRAMAVRATRPGPAAAIGRNELAGTHTAGTSYVVRAWVHSTSGRKVALRVREISGGQPVQSQTTRVSAGKNEWTRILARLTVQENDSALRLRLRSPKVRGGERFLVDDLRVTKKGTVPPTGTTPDTAGKLTNGCDHNARGIPSCGTYVGAAHGSNTDPGSLEKDLGDQLGVRRTYFTGSNVSSAIRTATTDIAAGRVPWLSFKLPYSWTAMADGKGDVWATDLATRLAALKGPVWVAFHHEPEGDGDMQEWRRMQEHLAPLIRKNAPNVAYTVVMTGWNQFYGDKSYSLDKIWPRGVQIDVAGFDIYQQYGVTKNGKTTTKWTDFEQYYKLISSWAKTVDVDWALGETGVTDAAAKARPDEIANSVRLMEQYGGIAYSYFNSGLNSVANWTLSTTAKKDGFAKALKAAPSLK